MTDEQQFLTMCERFGLLVTKVDPARIEENHAKFLTQKPAVSYALYGDKTIGYSGFYSEWFFTSEGVFAAVGTWE